MIQFLVALALCYVLIKIPFWILGSLRGSRGGRSMVGSLVRGVIAYKTFGLVRGLVGTSSSSSSRRPQRPSAGEASSGDESGAPGLAVPNPVAAMRRWRQRRWSDPDPGMLPMKLRRPKVAHEIGTQRQTLGEEFDDPERVMPWQQESPSYTPGLLNHRGGINSNARRERNPRKVEHPERGMLNVNLRHNSRGVGLGATPMRSRLFDDFDDPQRKPPVAAPKTSRSLLAEDGAVEDRAKARNPVPEPISPEPGMLPMTLWPKRQPPPAPAEPAEPRPSRQPRPQQALLHQRGAVTQNARARQPRRRATRPAGSTQQHQPRQTNRSQQQNRPQQQSEGSERG